MNGLEYVNQNRQPTLQKRLITDAQRLYISDMEEWLRITRNAINIGTRSPAQIRDRAAGYVRHLRRVVETQEVAAEFGWTDPIFQPLAPRPIREERHWQEAGLAWTPF